MLCFFRRLRFFTDHIDHVQQSLAKVSDFIDGQYVLRTDHMLRVRGLIEANNALIEENRRLRALYENPKNE
jgi:hypothetical protein